MSECRGSASSLRAREETPRAPSPLRRARDRPFRGREAPRCEPVRSCRSSRARAARRARASRDRACHAERAPCAPRSARAPPLRLRPSPRTKPWPRRASLPPSRERHSGEGARRRRMRAPLLSSDHHSPTPSPRRSPGGRRLLWRRKERARPRGSVREASCRRPFGPSCLYLRRAAGGQLVENEPHLGGAPRRATRDDPADVRRDVRTREARAAPFAFAAA